MRILMVVPEIELKVRELDLFDGVALESLWDWE